MFKLKDHERAALFSPPENKCLPASTLKPEESEFVVDSGASMHMISKKDQSKAEMDTLTKSCSPTIVITANGEVQTQEEAIVYVKELDVLFTMKVVENTTAVLPFGKLIPTNGSMVKNHTSFKTGSGFHAIRRTSFLSWFQACQVRPLDLDQLQRHLRDNVQHLVPARLLHLQQVKFRLEREREGRVESYIPPVHVSTTVDDRAGRLHDTQADKIPKPNKKESKKEGSDSLCSEIPEFRENLVDDEIPLQGGSHASSSHEASLEPTTKRREDLGKHSVFTHFPKDRNCEICKGTNITKAPCRRRNSGAVPRAENFGDLITADHKVLCDNCESRKKITNMQLWCRT